MAGNSYVVRGCPGSGKTTLGIQYVYNGALDLGQPGMILTFEERPEKLYRDAESLGIGLQRLQDEGLIAVVSSSPQAVRSMLLDGASPLVRSIDRLRVRRVFVDSLTAFRKVYRDEWDLRDAIAQLVNGLLSKEVTPLMVREVHEAPQGPGQVPSFEDYLVDAVLELGYLSLGHRRRTRYVEVIKTRSHPHIGGKHSLRIGGGGLEVFPSCQAEPGLGLSLEVEIRARVRTGIPGLDSLLQGGLPKGSSTMLAGSSGTGKTMICLQFLAKALQGQGPTLYITLREPPSSLIREAESIGLPLAVFLDRGLLQILYRSPIGLDVDELLFSIRKSCSDLRPERVVLDSLSGIAGAAPDGAYLRDLIYALTSSFGEVEATSLLTYEVPELFGRFTLNKERFAGIIDNLIFLRYIEIESRIRRAISVIKTRGIDHDKAIHELVIDAQGGRVAETFEGREDLMSGAPKRVGGAGPLGIDEIVDQLAQRQGAMNRLTSLKKRRREQSIPGLEDRPGRTQSREWK